MQDERFMTFKKSSYTYVLDSLWSIFEALCQQVNDNKLKFREQVFKM